MHSSQPRCMSLMFSVLLFAVVMPAQVIHTVAGGGPPDNIVATSAGIVPYGPAVDASGNLYFAGGSNSVYKLDSGGRLTRVAGQGTLQPGGRGGPGNGCGAAPGDGGPAASAQLEVPTAVALDASGNIYIADDYLCRVRVVNTQASTITVLGVTIAPGNIATVAGSSTFGYSGDGGPATSAQLNFPNGVAVDAAGNLYIADTENFRIRKVGTSGTITTVAGNGTAGYSGDGGAATAAELNTPDGVAVDAAGNIYIADLVNNRVRAVNTQASTITVLGVTIAPGNIATVAGNGTAGYSGDGGAAISAELSSPYGMTADQAGNLYIADESNDRVRKVDTSGTITSVAGNGTAGYSGDGGTATSAELNFPSGVAVDAGGTLYITDAGNYRIRVVDTTQTITTVAGNGTAGYSGDGGAATGAQLYEPQDVVVDTAGNYYIADVLSNRIRAVNTQGSAITVVGVTIAPGNVATVAGNGAAGYSGDGGASTSAELYFPGGVAVDAVGNLYIADVDNSRIRKVSSSGTITTAAGNGVAGYSGDGGAATVY